MASTVEVVLAALYLRGAPRPADPPRRGWPEIVNALRRESASIEQASELLHRLGATQPAAILEAKGLLAWAERAVEDGAVLTILSEGYPRRWLGAFGDLAPPALWQNRPVPSGKWIGAVGSRDATPEALAYMEAVAERATALGLGIVSGGAQGCDTAAEKAASTVLRLLPHGLMLRQDEDVCQLSLAAPHEPFSRPLAMERNALIYGAAELTVIGQVEMRKGGTWHGATDALRRRFGRVVVRPDDSPASRGLMALGAGKLESPEDLAFALAAAPSQRALFAYERRRRRAYRGA
jgi:predicted Rossmann fold nucleotide-binding protein DprA/Smf involved in DNA uptake